MQQSSAKCPQLKITGINLDFWQTCNWARIFAVIWFLPSISSNFYPWSIHYIFMQGSCQIIKSAIQTNLHPKKIAKINQPYNFLAIYILLTPELHSAIYPGASILITTCQMSLNLLTFFDTFIDYTNITETGILCVASVPGFPFSYFAWLRQCKIDGVYGTHVAIFVEAYFKFVLLLTLWFIFLGCTVHVILWTNQANNLPTLNKSLHASSHFAELKLNHFFLIGASIS